MAEYVARERLYHTVDRSKVVKEGDPEAAFLLAGEGDVISESEVKRLKLESHFQEAKPADPAARTKARLEDALARGAFEEARAHQAALGVHELAVESGAPERVLLERGRAGEPTAGVPTPSRAPKAAEREAPKALVHEAPPRAAAGEKK
jgi:hypothetical protein